MCRYSALLPSFAAFHMEIGHRSVSSLQLLPKDFIRTAEAGVSVTDGSPGCCRVALSRLLGTDCPGTQIKNTSRWVRMVVRVWGHFHHFIPAAEAGGASRTRLLKKHR